MKKVVVVLIAVLVLLMSVYITVDFTRVCKVNELKIAKEFYENKEVLRILDFEKIYPQIDITKEYFEKVGEIKVEKTVKKASKDLLSSGDITYMLPNGECLLIKIKENIIQINDTFYKVKEGNLEDIRKLLDEYNKKGGISKILWEEE